MSHISSVLICRQNMGPRDESCNIPKFKKCIPFAENDRAMPKIIVNQIQEVMFDTEFLRNSENIILQTVLKALLISSVSKLMLADKVPTRRLVGTLSVETLSWALFLFHENWSSFFSLVRNRVLRRVCMINCCLAAIFRVSQTLRLRHFN